MASDLRARLIAALGDAPDGKLSDGALKERFVARYNDLVPILNELLGQNRLELYSSSGKGQGLSVCEYKLVDEQTASVLAALSPEQVMVLEEIKRAGNMGVWQRDIKTATNIQQQTLTKTLKALEANNHIKSVKSVTSKTKKLYMLYDLVPSREITGGPWYTDQEFDYDFVDGLAQVVYQYTRQERTATLHQITEMIQQSGVSRVELSQSDVQLIVDSLEHDLKIERVGNELHPSPETTYKIAEPITHHNHLTAAENVLAFLENEQPLGFPLNPELESYGWRPIRFVPPSPDDPERADGRRRSRSRSR